jgi:hypothetical protein
LTITEAIERLRAFTPWGQGKKGTSMLNSWFALTMLAIESNEVVSLRLVKLAMGGAGAWDEVDMMVSEKIGASLEAFASVLSGESSLSVINRYRELVGANCGRLRSTADLDMT